MLTDFNPGEFDTLKNEELQNLVNTVEALLIAEELKQKEGFNYGYKMEEKETCQQLLLYANERGIFPTKDPNELTALVLSIQASSEESCSFSDNLDLIS